MAKILILGTARYCINMCDFDLLFRKSKHEIVQVIYHHSTNQKTWLRSGYFGDQNRNKISTKLLQLPHDTWTNHEELNEKLSEIDCDYMCLGNGNDDAGLKIQKDWPDAKFLFSEYGWMPWKECAYIDNMGTGKFSSIYQMKIEEMHIDRDRSDEINRIKSILNKGNPVPYRDFIYVPLQVDTPTSDGKPDFKFRFTKFKSNEEFLNFIRQLIPQNINIVAKDHPSARRATKFPDGVINATKMNLNRHELYNKMKAMAVINSTSAIEAMMFGSKIFSYGEDAFSNKGIVHESIQNTEEFVSLLDENPNLENYNRFVSTLLQRQIYRHQCSDQNYIDNHFWVNNL